MVNDVTERLPDWLTSDTHFLLSDLGYRPEDADSFITSGWKARVNRGDVVWHLGDVGLASASFRQRLRVLLRDLPGRVVLMPGNWDDLLVTDLCRYVGWDVQPNGAMLELDGWWVSFQHYPEPEVAERWLSVHGHLHRPGRPPYEPSPRHLNVAAALHDWSLVPARKAISARIEALKRPRS